MSRTNANSTDSDSEKARIGAAMRAQLKLASHVGFDSAATSCDDEREDALTLSQSIGRKSDIDPDQLLAQLQALEADDGDAPPPASDAPARSTAERVLRALAELIGLLICLYFFFLTLDLLALAFRCLGKGVATSIDQITTNPLVGFVAGLFLTVVLQSSSTTTSIIVVMVSTGVISVGHAVYAIMGANVGTSITSSFVALAHIRSRAEFSLAFSGATVHDIFNLLSVAILLPVEALVGLTNDQHRGVLGWLAHLMVGNPDDSNMSEGIKFTSPIKAIVGPLAELILAVDKKKLGMENFDGSVIKGGVAQKLVERHGWSDEAVGVLFLVLSVLGLSVTLILLVKMLKRVMQGKTREWVIKILSLSPYLAILMGAGLTVLVQSSSIVTSVIVPLVGIGSITLEQAYPLTIGSNLGTTITGFLAAFGTNGLAGFEISLVHLLFNIAGTLIWFPVPWMRQWPLLLAKRLGEAAARRRYYGFMYIFGVFMLVPGVLLALSFAGNAAFFSVVGICVFFIAVWAVYEFVRRKHNDKLPPSLQTYPRIPDSPSWHCWSPFYCHPWCREEIAALDTDEQA